MPLVVPGLTSNDKEKVTEQDWLETLSGKKIGESHDETTFAKSDLPEKHRVVGHGDMVTMDFVQDRFNIHTDEEGRVNKVTKG